MVDLSNLFLNPEKFLNENLLVMDTSPIGTCPHLTPVIGNFTIAEHAEFDNASRKGFFGRRKSINVLKVSWKNPPGPNAVPAYWLPYEENKTKKATLSNDVPFMFTAPMSGCSFGVSTFGNGTARVAHVNHQTAEGEIDTAKMTGAVSEFRKAFHRDTYRTSVGGKTVASTRHAGLLMTIIGVNDVKKGWKFYGQQYELDLVTTEIQFHELKNLTDR